MTTERATITDERLDELERVSIIRRAQTPPENGPAIAIECDTLDALITALRQARARLDAAEQTILDVWDSCESIDADEKSRTVNIGYLAWGDLIRTVSGIQNRKG